MPVVSDSSRKAIRRSVVAVVALLGVSLLLEGCYYMQAARGQLEVLNKREPIDEVLADDTTPDALKSRLLLVQEARDFAVDELLLPDNRSYRSYSDLERDYVVWNVFAAPEFSLQPKTWCYPIAGCVAYRGYFAEADARAMAQRLEADGYDVSIGGVSAYSTLGRFADPVLNTMMRWSDMRLVNTIFHELAHQKLYVKDDTAFNESFATAVADIGIERWLAARGEPQADDGFRRDRELRASMMSLVEATKTELTTLYASSRDDAQKRAAKRELLDELSAAAATLAEAAGGSNWLAAPLNNARLASLGLYEGRRDAFAAILDGCSGDIGCFYAESAALAELDREVRTQRLDALAD